MKADFYNTQITMHFVYLSSKLRWFSLFLATCPLPKSPCTVLFCLHNGIMKYIAFNRQGFSLMPAQFGNFICFLCGFSLIRQIPEISHQKGKARCSEMTNDLGTQEFQLSIFISNISWKSISFIYLVELRVRFYFSNFWSNGLNIQLFKNQCQTGALPLVFIETGIRKTFTYKGHKTSSCQNSLASIYCSFFWDPYPYYYSCQKHKI